MADPLDLLPIRQESIYSIRARVDADANAGMTPEDDGYLDLTPGGFWWDNTQAIGLELERLWDFAAHEVPAAIFLLYSYGTFLDDHGEALGVPRKDESAATGVVRFTGTSGTIITLGARVAAPTTDPEADPQSYVVTAGGTVPIAGFIDLPVQAETAGAVGNAAATSVTLLETPIDDISAVSNPDAISGGADVEEDDAYRERLLLEMRGQGGGGTQSQFTRWALEVSGIGAVTVQPRVAGPGTGRVMVRDTENNPVSQIKMDEVQNHLDPSVADTLSSGAHTLPLGGAAFTVDDTTGFRDSGRFYVLGQFVSYTGRTGTTFTGCTGGTGVIPDNTPVHQGGQGLGKATIGVDVVVGTPSTLNVTVAATVVFEPGYSLDGSGGTTATEDDIKAAIQTYIDGLDVGEDVILNHVEARMFRVRGVFDVSGTTLNGVASNLAVSAEQVAQIVAINLS